MTVADLYLTLVVVGICMAAGAYVYKVESERNERIAQLERRYAALPPYKEDVLSQLRTPRATVGERA